MATRAELEAALRAADKAGAADDARRLAAALQNYVDPQSELPAPPSAKEVFDQMPMWQKPIQATDDILRKASNGLTFGFRDKLAQYLGGGTPEEERAKTQAASERAGTAGDVAELGGMMLPTYLTGGATAAVPAAAGPVARTALSTGIAGLEGAGYGGINAVGHDEDPIKGMESGAAWGAGGNIVGGLLSAAGNKIGSYFNKPPARLSVDELKAQKNQAYDNVAKAGVEYTPGTIRGMLHEMDQASPAYPNRHDQVIAAKNKVDANIGTVPRPVTLPEVDLNRQIIDRDLSSLPDSAQQGMGLDIMNAMDDSLDRVGPLGVTARSGDPTAGLDELNHARKLNQRMRKLEQIERVTDKAQLQADKSLHQGFDSTMKNNVTGLLTNPKKMRGYTPDEEAQMREVVSGTPKQNIERQIGRLSPGGGLSFAGSSAAAMAAGALSNGNPYIAGTAAVVPPLVGWLSKHLSEKGTKRSAETLLDLVASGGNKAAITPKPTMTAKDKDALGKLIMMQMMQQSNQRQ